MTKHTIYESSSLFLLRVWREEGDGGIEWCGNVRRTAGGEAHPFRGWHELEVALLELVPDAEAAPCIARTTGQVGAGEFAARDPADI